MELRASRRQICAADGGHHVTLGTSKATRSTLSRPGAKMPFAPSSCHPHALICAARELLLSLRVHLPGIGINLLTLQTACNRLALCPALR